VTPVLVFGPSKELLRRIIKLADHDFSAAARLPAPIQLEAPAMPADKAPRRHHGKRFFPIEEARPEYQ
jgi:hypothetical protein